MIDLDGATLRVSAGYTLKVPADVAYSSEDAHAGISVEVELSDVADVEGLTKQAELLHADLYAAVKLSVFAQLGVEYEVDQAGAIRPKLTAKPKAQAATPAAPTAQGMGGSSRQQFMPAANRDNLPVVVLDGTAYYDQRPLIETGEFKPRAATFRSVQKVDGEYKNLWLTAQDGSPNTEVLGMLERAGLEVPV